MKTIERESNDKKYIIRNIYKSNNDDDIKVHTQDAFTKIIINKIKQSR